MAELTLDEAKAMLILGHTGDLGRDICMAMGLWGELSDESRRRVWEEVDPAVGSCVSGNCQSCATDLLNFCLGHKAHE
jgi:hypothetical protein